MLARIDAVTLDDVRAVAATLLTAPPDAGRRRAVRRAATFAGRAAA